MTYEDIEEAYRHYNKAVNEQELKNHQLEVNIGVKHVQSSMMYQFSGSVTNLNRGRFTLGMGRISASADVPHFFDIFDK